MTREHHILTAEFVAKWLQANQQITERWIEQIPEINPDIEIPEHAQRFVTTRVGYPRDGTRKMREELVDVMTKIARDEFHKNLARALVFGIKASFDDSHQFSGFYETTGRLPTTEDRIEINGMIRKTPTVTFEPRIRFVGWIEGIRILP